MVSFGFLYARRLYTINPDSVYRKAMYMLNTNPGILEVITDDSSHTSFSLLTHISRLLL